MVINLTCNNNTWKNYNNQQFNIKINKALISETLFKIKMKFVDKIYHIFQYDNYHFFLPFIDLGMMMYIYDNINQYRTKSTYLPYYSQEVVQLLIDIANEVLIALISSEEDQLSIATIILKELKSYINIPFDNKQIKEIKYMLEYINTLFPPDVSRDFYIMNIYHPLTLNNNTVDILNQFMLCWRSGELRYIDQYKDIIMHMYYLPSNIKISINMCKDLLQYINIHNSPIYYINKNMLKTIYYEAKVQAKNQNHDIKLHHLEYQKPSNNIYYLRDYTQLFTTTITPNNTKYTNSFIDTLLLQSQFLKDELLSTTMNVLPHSANKLPECHKLLQQIQQTSPDHTTSIFITLLSNVAN